MNENEELDVFKLYNPEVDEVKECNCEKYQCCEKCMDKFEFKGKSIFEPIFKELKFFFEIVLAMEKASKKWGDLR